VKPSGPIARRENYRIERRPHAEAKKLIEMFHYAKGAANTSVACHGLVRISDAALVGAALWMPPTANAAKGLARAHLGSSDRHREVLVLSRLVVAPGEPKNAATLFLGGSERLVRTDDRWSLLATYADRAEGHTGTIYRATNWTYDGETRPEARWRDPRTGRLVAKKATRSRTIDEMKEAGFVRDSDSRKIRFVKVIR
jgi:hypothetical protein